MCIAILKTKDGNITDEQLRNCFDSNPDGAGIAYSKNGKLFMIKGIFNSDEFVNAYHNAVNEADGAMLIHCRISTSGNVDKLNCHPHVVNDECVMIHNGILSIDVPKDSKVSDTVLYVDKFLKPLPKDFMKDEGIINLITHDIGAGNKFVFLNNKGEYAIANEKAGHWKNGVWFSNYSYQSYTWGRSKNFSYGAYGYGSYWDDEDEYMDSEYFELTTEEEYQLELVVANLTDEEVLKLGSNPTYNFYSQSLMRINPVKGSVSRLFLDEVSPSIATDLETRYYEVLDNICYNNRDIETTDVSLKTLIDEVRQEIANGGNETYASELLEELMDDEYKDFMVDILDTYDELVEVYPEMSFENNLVDEDDEVSEDEEVIDAEVEVDYSSDRLQDVKSEHLKDTRTLVQKVNGLLNPNKNNVVLMKK